MNWGQRINEAILKLEELLVQSKGRLIWDSNTDGDISDTEILTYDGEILRYP